MLLTLFSLCGQSYIRDIHPLFTLTKYSCFPPQWRSFFTAVAFKLHRSRLATPPHSCENTTAVEFRTILLRPISPLLTLHLVQKEQRMTLTTTLSPLTHPRTQCAVKSLHDCTFLPASSGNSSIPTPLHPPPCSALL